MHGELLVEGGRGEEAGVAAAPRHVEHPLLLLAHLRQELPSLRTAQYVHSNAKLMRLSVV